uniref:Methyltransferase domain-containing protein n=1 Tax=Candidatus Kentrum eta TaxID=2126337 RepID=A0A450VIJ9_9GAMM|nr:MAG: hypothetical protein BECKH772B_GA0070898_104581 [Candidatus Kentron sp. H]VFK04680.1 MAG: hypothetical protein BECKH772A_GA0070896_104471 [Candidatus Kentron sp. H]VFK08114.1 MAG: hypothetical protein BECKH772C_GA0070978_104881 [Candidatus Kentron sp. H]
MWVGYHERNVGDCQRSVKKFDNVCLSQQNIVTLSLEDQYDTTFSYGGVWYFSDYSEGLFLISHIYDGADNKKAIERLSKHIKPGGKLLLGIQGPHYDYRKSVSNGMIYSKNIVPTSYGFRKYYYLMSEDRTVMTQTILYRTYTFDEAISLLADHGLVYNPEKRTESEFFVEFEKI